MTVEPGNNILVCEYCGSKELMIESAGITLERIKSETRQRGFKTARDLKEIEYKQHESQKGLELEKLYYEEKREIRKNKREWKLILITYIVLGILGAIAFAFISSAEKRDIAAGKIVLPAAAESYIGSNYYSVEIELSDAGFTNITSRPLNDLSVEEQENVNLVCKIMINNKTDFQGGSRYLPDVPIFIYYHSTPGE